ncbi:ShlB/FhaC/HecB family hemolysin secretion/activation protein [Sporomusa sp. KB1]|jgi:hemolysin activation/secretion protein|uniref:ShlB/FhaC/HecB family hemolysin secretion/activation protein n=1 Tax=Sporomusa sp. KB1 TaxID=943346 RepID=UPI0011A842CF|nr:ShlB/FhaC/HecB family hemolysin secretion/activation protein [Sporomusa sp. KB1]TWH45072.1 hemolysin activation/secretion protein [Sporomusa sp. KB1]
MSLLTLSVLLVSGTGYAATSPNIGSAIESAKSPVSQQPAEKLPAIMVEGQLPAPQESGDAQKISVRGFRIGGESPVPESELLKMIQSESGKDLTLSQLNALAGKLTQHFRQKGYIVAYAYIPAQDIVGGIVEIVVIPGKYGQIKVSGDAHIGKERLTAMLSCAKPGMIIRRASLERALLLVNDLSGVSVKATLKPGETTGTADLVLETADTAKTNGAAYADNWGSRYTGRTRYGSQFAINNFSGNGDAFNLGGLTTGQGINDYNLGYSAQLGHDGAKAEIKYSHVGYTLGDAFSDLGATGRAVVTSYDISYPFIRGRAFSLYGTIGYDVKHLHDDIDDYSYYLPRTSKMWNLGLSGNFADSWLGGGMNAFSLTQYRGKLSFDDASALANDASTAQTNGDFAKTVLTFQRQQYVAKNLNFNFSFIGQLADKNLDSSEKLFLGGADGVRAFPQGEASGDEGYKLTGEFRWQLPGLSKGKSNLYLNAFYDYGSVMINKRPYSTDANRRSLMGAGLGLLWTRTQDFAIRMDYAWKLGKEAATSDTNANGRLWLQGIKYF